jgi:hypothetical protein
LKTLSLFAPPPDTDDESGRDAGDADEMFLHQSTQMIRHALSTGLIPSQPHGFITLNDFAEWLESQIDVGDSLDETTSLRQETGSREAVPRSPRSLTQVSGVISADLKGVNERLGLAGFTAEDFMDLLGESADAGFVSLSSWLHIVELMNQLASTASPSAQSSDLATVLFESLSVLSNSSPLSSSSRFRDEEGRGGAESDGLEYHILLSSLLMFCDSPVEDKIAVIFTVLSETIRGDGNERSDDEDCKRVTARSLLFFLECVLTVLSLTSPTVRQILSNTQQPTEVIARETLRYGMGRLEKDLSLSLRDASFGMDDFCRLLWAMLEAEAEAEEGEKRR